MDVNESHKLSKKTYRIQINQMRSGQCLVSVDDRQWLYRFHALSLNAKLVDEDHHVMSRIRRKTWWRRNKLVIETADSEYLLHNTLFNTWLYGNGVAYETRGADGFFDNKERVTTLYHDDSTHRFGHINDLCVDVDSRYDAHWLALITATCYQYVLMQMIRPA